MLFQKIPAVTLGADPLTTPQNIPASNVAQVITEGMSPFNLALICSPGAGPMNVEIYGCAEIIPEPFGTQSQVANSALQWFSVGTVAIVASGALSFLGSASLLTVLPAGKYYIRPTTGLAANASVLFAVVPVAV